MAKYGFPVLPIDGNNEAAVDHWYYMGDLFDMGDGTYNNGDHEILTSSGYYLWVHPNPDERYETAIATYLWTGTGTTQEVTKKVKLNTENEIRTWIINRINLIANNYFIQNSLKAQDWQRCREIWEAWQSRGGKKGIKPIGNVSQGNPVVVNVPGGHNLVTDEYCHIYDVVGTEQVNWHLYKATRLDAYNIQLRDTDGNPIDGTGFGAYVSGGELRETVLLTADEEAHFDGETGDLTANEFYMKYVEWPVQGDSQFIKLVRSIKTGYLEALGKTDYVDLPSFDYLYGTETNTDGWTAKTDFNSPTQRPTDYTSDMWGLYLNRIDYWTE